MKRPASACLAVLAGSVILVCAACAPGVLDASASSLPTASPSTTPSPSPHAVWPLTGVPVSADAVAGLSQVTLAVKIENTRESRPQKGLEYADIVIEEYVEYGISRLVAVYHSDIPEDIGPIRSLRPMDINIVGSMFAALVFSGSSSGPLSDAQATDQVLLAEDLHSSGFFRVGSKPVPHNLWGSTADLIDSAVEAGIGPAVPQFDYAYPPSQATAALEGEGVTMIDLAFSPLAHPHWLWDQPTALWHRFEYESPHVSAEGTPLTATNLVILLVEVRYVYGTLPESLVVVDDAAGFVATGGSVTPIRWHKSERRDEFHLTTLDGDPVALAPGQTWVELLPFTGAAHVSSLEFDGVVQ